MKEPGRVPIYEPAACRDLVFTDVARVRSRDGMVKMVLCVRDELIDVAEPTDVLRAKVSLFVPAARMVPNLLTVIQELDLQAEVIAALCAGRPLRACN